MIGNGHGAVQVRVRAVRLVTVTEGATGGPGGPTVVTNTNSCLFLLYSTFMTTRTACLVNVWIENTADSGVVDFIA